MSPKVTNLQLERKKGLNTRNEFSKFIRDVQGDGGTALPMRTSHYLNVRDKSRPLNSVECGSRERAKSNHRKGKKGKTR